MCISVHINPFIFVTYRDNVDIRLITLTNVLKVQYTRTYYFNIAVPFFIRRGGVGVI